MALLEQYPEYAMMTNKRGERETKPWVSGGMSPIARGLMAAGLGILSQPQFDPDGWDKPTGGSDYSGIARAGLLGLQEFQKGHQDLQEQRKDFYTHRNALMDQVAQNQAAKRQQEEYLRMQTKRENRDKSFPELLQMLNNSDRPEVRKTVPMLKTLYDTDPDKAVAASMNIVSQLKTPLSAVEVKPIIDAEGNPTGHSYITQNGEYKTTVKTGASSIGDLKLDTKTLNGILFKGSQPNSKMSPSNYRKYYKMLQQGELVKGVVKDGEKQKMGMFAGPLESFQTPWEFGKSRGLSESAMTKMGWKKDPSIEQWMQEGKGLPGSEQQKSGFKFGQIAQTEEDIAALINEGYDPTKVARPADWAQYIMGTNRINPFGHTPELQLARSAENAYMGGAQGFAYLFSGATVRAEELIQFRQIMYPVPGDSKFDVERKAKRRKRIMDLYNSISPDSMKQAYELANQASNDDGLGPLKRPLERKGKIGQKGQVEGKQDPKKQVEGELIWE